ncbi:MAG: 4Fe-4S binding protein [Cyclobacteriaceae bacterium]|nr:4Fe-4S binding protein [Cyclobacteriaceae bacterium]
MKKSLYKIFFMISGILIPVMLFAQQRFPRPDFESGYQVPSPTTPEPRSASMELFDVFLLLGFLSLVTWFVLKKRSRKGILYLSILALLYFGFYRNGCICAIGGIQNVALAIADPGYAISLTALAFFVLPLLFALFAGRVFCAGVCPLGAIQELIILKPVSIPKGLQKALGLIPYVYLGLAILYAVTRTDFIICRYDPFVGIFRLDATYTMLLLGGSFLILGMFVARPYCRFLCPYAVLLNWMSANSWKHLSITPAECIDCKLCDQSCPVDAINKPAAEPVSTHADTRRFLLSLILIPVLVFLGGFILSKSHIYLSRANHTVQLAELLITNPEVRNDPENLDVQAFLTSGKTLDLLVNEAAVIRRNFKTGGWWVGGFFGLAFGLIFAGKTVFRNRKDYTPDKGNCLSCGRCMNYCPVGKPDYLNLMKDGIKSN